MGNLLLILSAEKPCDVLFRKVSVWYLNNLLLQPLSYSNDLILAAKIY